jgi:hypothetical protein
MQLNVTIIKILKHNWIEKMIMISDGKLQQ